MQQRGLFQSPVPAGDRDPNTVTTQALGSRCSSLDGEALSSNPRVRSNQLTPATSPTKSTPSKMEIAPAKAHVKSSQSKSKKTPSAGIKNRAVVKPPMKVKVMKKPAAMKSQKAAKGMNKLSAMKAMKAMKSMKAMKTTKKGASNERNRIYSSAYHKVMKAGKTEALRKAGLG